MAWIFSLWVQCREVAQAKAIDKHFEGFTSTLSNGLVTTCHVARPVLGCDTCCWVVPTNVSRHGVQSETDAAILSELGRHLYDHLRKGPAFWLALVGAEVDDVRSESDVLDLLGDAHLAWRGLVVARKTWVEAGEPAGFEPFRPGSVWRPYPGEPWPPP